MITFQRTSQFDIWLSKLKDTKGKGRILHRIRSAERGNFGDYGPVGRDVFDIRKAQNLAKLLKDKKA